MTCSKIDKPPEGANCFHKQDTRNILVGKCYRIYIMDAFRGLCQAFCWPPEASGWHFSYGLKLLTLNWSVKCTALQLRVTSWMPLGLFAEMDGIRCLILMTACKSYFKACDVPQPRKLQVHEWLTRCEDAVMNKDQSPCRAGSELSVQLFNCNMCNEIGHLCIRLATPRMKFKGVWWHGMFPSYKTIYPIRILSSFAHPSLLLQLLSSANAPITNRQYLTELPKPAIR